MLRCELLAHSFLEKQPFAAALYDKSFKIVASSLEFRALFNYPVEQTGSISPSEYIHPDDLQSHEGLLGDIFSGQSSIYTVELHCLSKLGSLFSCSVIGIGIKHPTGEVAYTLEIFSCRPQGRLRKSEVGSWRFSFMHNPHGIAVISPVKGTFAMVNQGYADMHGYSAHEMRDMPVLEVYPAESHEHILRVMTELTQTKFKEFDIQHKKKDGSLFWANVNAAFAYDEQLEGPTLLAVCRDITEIKRLEEARDEALRRAEAASKAKNEFLANMSHEIRTPMNGVMGMIDLALLEDLPPRARSFLELSKQSSSLLLSIINDILDLSKIEAEMVELHPEPFSLSEVVASTVDSFLPAAMNKNLALEQAVAPELPDNLVGDAGRLRQILVNLLGNALKFTPQGRIRVTVEATDGSGQTAAGTVQVLFRVNDSGIGIPEDKHQEIFESFSQVGSSAHMDFGGTGLGLAISRNLVELMGGRIWVESTPGEGSTFSFVVPFKMDACQPSPQ